MYKKILLFLGLASMTHIMANHPDDRIEFGFVLLPKDDIGCIVKKAKNSINPQTASGANTPAALPHVSLGQYGVLRAERDKLKVILERVAKNFKVYLAPMADHLSVTAENIFFDFAKVGKDTDPKLVKLYKAFREQYFKDLKAPFPIAQALYEKAIGDKGEGALIDQYYQNWGTPEGDRIRPHFTMIYSYNQSKQECEAALQKAKINLPKTIKFNRLAIVEIDRVGNGIKILFEVILSS